MQAILRTLILKFLALALFLLTGLSLAACAPQQIEPGTDQIRVEWSTAGMRPYHWRVNASQEVTLTLSNNSPESHSWVLLSQPYSSPYSEAQAGSILAEFSIQPGQVLVVHFTTPAAAGEYDVVCSLPEHAEAGEIGTLLVVRPMDDENLSDFYQGK